MEEVTFVTPWMSGSRRTCPARETGGAGKVMRFIFTDVWCFAGRAA
jgi:hypothetical protein